MVIMISMASWNIRGMNHVPKQNDVQQVVRENNLCVCAVLESHIHFSKLQKICSRVFTRWNWVSNVNHCAGGSRIILGWDPQLVDLMILSSSDQVIHCQVCVRADQKSFFYSFIYAGNNYMHRRELWRNLCKHSIFVKGKPRALLGDFNTTLNFEDSSVGTSRHPAAMSEFKECVEFLR